MPESSASATPENTTNFSITTDKLSKSFRTYETGEGLLSIAKSILFRRYEDVHALKDATLNIESGTCVGLLGANGAGKTTLVKILSGLVVPTSGNATVLGFIPWQRHPEYLKLIGVVMGQRQQMWIDVSAYENFRLNQVIYDIAPSEFNKRLNKLSKMLEVHKLLNVPVRKLSLGEKMKMELLAAFLHRPRILFLDEPTIGLDIISQNTIREFISQQVKEEGVSVLLTSHYLKDLEELCSRVLLIQKGKLIHDGSLQDLVGVFAKMRRVVWVERGEMSREVADLGAKSLGDGRYYLEVSAQEVPSVVRTLVKSLGVEDLSIEQQPLEESVRAILTKGKQ